MNLEPRTQHPRLKRTLVKVPEITVVFWIAKILTTAMGESLSDYLVGTIPRAVAVVIGFFAFVVAMLWQFAQSRYRPWIYWTAVAMVAVFGTMAADVVHIGLGVPYIASTLFYGVALATVFAVWYRSEGTLSIHTIDSPAREGFYWLTVLTTFALGTAAGDLTAVTFGWGYLASGIAFGFVIAIPALLYARTALSRVAIFWFAYVLTRPVGASFADWFGKHIHGGLGIGDGTVVLVLCVLIAGSVAYLASPAGQPRRRHGVVLQPQE